MEKCSRYCVLEYAKMGFKFQPSKTLICETYLKLKIQGKKLPCKHMIVDENMYEDYSSPWELFKSDDPRWIVSTESSGKKVKKVIYVFTMLKKKGKRVLRKAGCGTWTGQNGYYVVNEGGAYIGFDRLLTFKVDHGKKMNDDEHGKWTMHEYTLHPDDYNYAICKITKEEHGCGKLVAFNYDQGMPKEEPYMHQNEEISDNILDSDVALLVNPVQVQPLLDSEWLSYTEIINQFLEQEQVTEDCDGNIIAMQYANELDALTAQGLSEENMINELAQPQGVADNWNIDYYTYPASDPLFELPRDYEETNDVEGYCPLPIDCYQVPLMEHEQQQQQTERSAYFSHLAAGNFDYYHYDQQKQQPEGVQNNSLEKRKSHSIQEEEFSNKKQQ